MSFPKKETATLGDEYVLVRKDQAKLDDESKKSGDAKSVTGVGSALTATGRFSSMSTGSMKSVKSRYQRIEVNLISLATMAGSTSATAFPVVNLTVSGAQDWSNYQGVYDMYRVKSFEFFCSPNHASGFTGFNGAGPYWAVAWDPSNTGAYSVPADVLTADKKIGPIAINAAASTATTGLLPPTLTMTPTGYRKLAVQLKPSGVPIMSVVNNTSLFAGPSWTPTGNTGAVHGYLKGVIPQTAGGNINIGVIIIARVEFAART
jgi:hypothetical protein